MTEEKQNKDLSLFETTEWQLSPEITEKGKTTAQRIKTRLSNAVLETGRDLLEMKKDLPHGAFESWVENEVGISPRTAQKAMSVQKNLGDKSEYYSLLGASVLYEIGRDNVHYFVKWRTDEAIEAGEKITLNDVKQWEKAGAKLDEIANDIRARNQEIAQTIEIVQDALDRTEKNFLNSQMENPEKQFREWANDALTKQAEIYRLLYQDDPMEKGDNLDYFYRFKEEFKLQQAGVKSE